MKSKSFRQVDAGMGIEELAHWAKKSKKKPAKASTGGPLPAKYKGPNGEMWAGRGHHPDWVVALGKTPEERKKGLEAYAIKA
jgi:DNA-binding protein H-NS